MPSEPPCIIRLSSADLPFFGRFLESLQANGDDVFFHPHRFDSAAARSITALSETGIDEYWIAVESDAVLAYGMLRGWSEGYAVPSLGLAVAPEHRGKGLARIMMQHLHARAKLRGAETIRLKVDRRNTAARRLYESLGYALQDHSSTELLGVVEVSRLAHAVR